MMLLKAGVGEAFVAFALIDPTSGPYAFSTKLTFSVVILAFLIKFIRSIALRSCSVGVPIA